jgi:hypothetical protein
MVLEKEITAIRRHDYSEQGLGEIVALDKGG